MPSLDDEELRQAYERLADQALATGEPALGAIEDQDIVAVPDVFVAEGEAIHGPLPDSYILERADGRSVRIFRMPVTGGRHLFYRF